MTRAGRTSALRQLIDFDVCAGACAVALPDPSVDYVFSATHTQLVLTSPSRTRSLGIHRPRTKDHPLVDGGGGAGLPT